LNDSMSAALVNKELLNETKKGDSNESPFSLLV
jgi:hypothetical protein